MKSESAPQMIKMRSAYGAINYLELVSDDDSMAQYEAFSNMPISLSYASRDEIVSIDFDGCGRPYEIGWKTDCMELVRITATNNFKEIYLYFKKI